MSADIVLNLLEDNCAGRTMGPGQAAIVRTEVVAARKVIAAAKNVLEYLDGMEIPYKDQHRPLQALHEALAPFTKPEEVQPVCDYCDEGNVAVDGWHVYVDDDLGYEGTSYRVPCAVNPPAVIE